MQLSQMKENEMGVIAQISDNCAFERRFFDMGFVTGEQVKCMNIGLCGSPIAYLVHGSKIALRKKDAELIGVVM